MARTMSALATGLWLLALAMVSWLLVGVSYAYTGILSFPALAIAVMFSGLAFAFPFLLTPPASRAHGPDPTGRLPAAPCRACGALPLPGIRFCIRCGAYPKPTPTRA